MQQTPEQPNDELRSRVVAWQRDDEGEVRPLREPGVRGSEEGTTMDRRVERAWWKSRRIQGIAAAVAFVGLVGYVALFGDHSRKLNVQRERITISTVLRGPFQEFIPVRGTVLPIRTVFMDAPVGGRVERVLLEEGTIVEPGDVILRLSNPDLELNVMNQTADIYQQINQVKNTRITLEQSAIAAQEQLIDVERNLQQARREFELNQKLWEIGAIARMVFEGSKNDFEHWTRRLAFAHDKAAQDSLSRALQNDQLERSLQQLQMNLDAVNRVLDDLDVKAPIGGQLTSLDAQIGAQKPKGTRLGQVDVLDGYRVRAQIDEFYIHRISVGQSGSCKVAGVDYGLAITKVFPEVVDGRFEVDMEFTGEAPAEIRRGQTLQIRLELGDLEEALLLARGGFYQTTGGNWAFVVAPGTDEAVRRDIRIGRQNPEYFEVLAGLQPGEQVVTSSYDNYEDMEKLVLK